jgi:hypothetical protein
MADVMRGFLGQRANSPEGAVPNSPPLCTPEDSVPTLANQHASVPVGMLQSLHPIATTITTPIQFP